MLASSYSLNPSHALFLIRFFAFVYSFSFNFSHSFFLFRFLLFIISRVLFLVRCFTYVISCLFFRINSCSFVCYFYFLLLRYINITPRHKNILSIIYCFFFAPNTTLFFKYIHQIQNAFYHHVFSNPVTLCPVLLKPYRVLEHLHQQNKYFLVNKC